VNWFSYLWFGSMIFLFGTLIGATVRENQIRSQARKSRNTELRELANKIRRSLESNGYKVLGGLEFEIDADTETLTIESELASRTFTLGQDVANSWYIFTYNRGGERLLMSKDTFEMLQLEVRDELKNRERNAGFDKAAKASGDSHFNEA
jgi:hypothetical protein